jgi:hypothetical protein
MLPFSFVISERFHRFLEFGTVHIPIRLQQEDSSLREIFKTKNMLSLELLAYHCKFLGLF